ncbi:MAG: hypothetical protein R3D34_15850 [Nitratireductor sp.]
MATPIHIHPDEVRLTVSQVSDHASVSVRTVKRWIACGELLAERLPSPGGRGHLRIRLRDLVNAQAFETVLRVLLRRNDNNATEALHGLAQGLLGVARHHVKVDAVTEARLKTLVSRLKQRGNGFRNRTRDRLEAVLDERILHRLLHMPARLLEEANTTRNITRKRMLAQLAFACELLLVAPLRISNVVSLRIGKTLVRTRDTRTGLSGWMVQLPAETVKNGRDLAYVLPQANCALLDSALLLYEQVDGWVFPGRSGGAKGYSVLSGQIARAVHQLVGIEWHAHMYRALAGYLVLRDNPANIEGVRQLLGNKDMAVIRENYAFLAERNTIAQAQKAIIRQRLELTNATSSRKGSK